MVLKCLNALAPAYFCDLLEWYRPSQCLRSEDKLMFSASKICNRMGGSNVWNKLPIKNQRADSFKKFWKAT